MTTVFGIGDIVRFNDGLSARILELEDNRTRVRLMVSGNEEWRDATAVTHIITQAPGPRPEAQETKPQELPSGVPTQPSTEQKPATQAVVVMPVPTEQIFAGETTLRAILQQLTPATAEVE